MFRAILGSINRPSDRHWTHATYKLSTRGLWIVASERPTDEARRYRFAMVGSIVLAGVAMLVYMSYTATNDMPLMFRLLVTFNTMLHTAHYADNILRPPYYNEPWAGYRKVFFAYMDKIWMLFWPLKALMIVSWRTATSDTIAAARVWLMLYALYSQGSLLHFYYEKYELHPVDMRLICVAEAAMAFVLAAYSFL